MTILVVLVGMLAGLAWFLPETEEYEKKAAAAAQHDPEEWNSPN